MVPAGRWQLRGADMRWVPNIAFGTESYPEKTARRLRAMNLAAWIFAATCAYFAVQRLVDPQPGLTIHLLISATGTVCFSLIPLLHRFGPVAAPLAFALLAYAWLCSLDLIFGTKNGAWLGFFSIAVLAVMVLGIERLVLTGALSALAAGLIIAVHLNVPPDTGALSPRALFYAFVANVVINVAALTAIVQYAMQQVARAEATAEREFERSESMLSNILPASVTEQLKSGKQPVVLEKFDEASILCADMTGFTARAVETNPEELMEFLNRVFTEFDRLVESHGLEKIRVNGDSYMVVSGVPIERNDHAHALAELALDMGELALQLGDLIDRAVPMRFGIASGPVVAGVVEARRIFYDVWGEPVRTAARLETTSASGCINVAPETRELLLDRFVLEERDPIEVEGKGPMRAWYLVGRRPAAA
jgi:adenylate cyclase